VAGGGNVDDDGRFLFLLLGQKIAQHAVTCDDYLILS